MTNGFVTLKEHIKKLLLEGKRGNHPDYLPFFELFGREKIIALALEIKEEEKRREENDQRD